MPITVVNKRNTHYDIYIGRGSKLGNPFVVGKHGSREEVIEKYKQHLLNSPTLLRSLHELKDQALGCFCAPLACHGDVLKAYAEKDLFRI